MSNRQVVVRRGRHIGWWAEGRWSSGRLFMMTWWPTEGLARMVASAVTLSRRLILAHFWLAFAVFGIALTLGAWQMFIRSPIGTWLSNPELYYRSLTAHGTLYKALARLEDLGLLTSRWEDVAATEGRPRRRLYELTGHGVHAAERARADRAAGRTPRLAPGPA